MLTPHERASIEQPTRERVRDADATMRPGGGDHARLATQKVTTWRCHSAHRTWRNAWRPSNETSLNYTEALSVEGNYGAYIEDLKRRKGPDADMPTRIKYKKLVRS